MEHILSYNLDEPIVQLMVRKKIIELKIKLFVNNLNLGSGIAVPKELRMSPYPDSFRFYDPTLSIMQRHCQNQTRIIFRMKKQMAM